MKRNSIEIGVKGLILAVTVIIAVILSALGLYMANTSKGTINNATTQYTNMTGEYSEIEATQYDGLDVNGTKVCDLIRGLAQNSATYSITVTTLMGSTVTYSATSGYTDPGMTAAAHINETGIFRGEVTKNANGMVTTITFKQH